MSEEIQIENQEVKKNGNVHNKSYHSKYGWPIRNPRITMLLMVTIIFWGIMSMLLIPKEEAPEVEFGIVMVNTTYPGASADDIDGIVTKELEKKLKDVESLNKMTSTSRNSISTITLEFNPGADMSKGLADIRSKIDQAKPSLPQDVNDPNIIEITSSDNPIFNIVLTGPYDQTELRDYGEILKSKLENVSRVNEIKISGGLDHEYQIILDPIKLNQYKLNPDQIKGQILRQNTDQPLGQIEIENFEYNLRYSGKYKSIEGLQNIPITQISTENANKTILLKDVATVKDTGEDADSITKFYKKGYKESTDAVVLELFTKKRVGVFESDKIIREAALSNINEFLPLDIDITFTQESISSINESYSTVASNGLQTIIIVFFVIWLFMGFREAITASLIVPLCTLITMIVLRQIDSTLNFMTNFSMILAIGMIVDAAIVVVEGTHDYIRQGYDRKSAAELTVDEFIAPLTSGNLTTLAVFIPLISLPGILGKYLAGIPITVTILLISSLFVSLIFTSTLCSLFLNEENIRHDENTPLLRRIISGLIEKIENGYKNFLIAMIGTRFRRLGLFYSLITLFILSFLIPVKFEMFPSDDTPFMTIEASNPIGAITSSTRSSIIVIENELEKIDEIKNYDVTISGNKANFFVELLDKDIREENNQRTSIQITDELAEKLRNLNELDVKFSGAAKGPPSDFPVGFRVIVKDKTFLSNAQKTVNDLKQMLEETEGTISVADDIENTPGDFDLTINKTLATLDGVDPMEIPGLIRTAIEGSKVEVIDKDDREYDVVIKFDKNDISNLNDISNVEVMNKQGQRVSIGKYIQFKLNPGFNVIKRQNTNVLFTASSDLLSGYTSQEVTDKMLEKINNYKTPEGITIENAGENAENTDLFMALAQSAVIAVLMIFIILVTQFNSFPQALLIIMAILLGQLGVNIGLFLTDTPRSLAFIIGAISLAGIVVNNSIILIDQMNKNPNRNTEEEDIIEIANSAKSRIKPIVLTSGTTVAGILPLVLIDNFWAGLGYTVVFGLLLGTSLTLFLTPGMYYQIQKDFKYTFKSFVLFLIVVTVLGLLFSLL